MNQPRDPFNKTDWTMFFKKTNKRAMCRTLQNKGIKMELLMQFLLAVGGISLSLAIAIGLLMGGKDDDFDGMA